MMHFTILAAGSRGDIQPYLALGVGLQAAGQRVRFAAFRNFADLAVGYDVDFHPVDADFQTLLGGAGGRRFIASGTNLFQFARELRRLVDPLMAQLGRDFWRACQDTDVIISGLNGLPFFGHEMAQKLGVASFDAAILPFMRTGEFPIPGWPRLPLGRAYNRFTYRMMEQVGWQLFRASINRWRRDTLDLPPAPFWGEYEQIRKQRRPMLIGISPSVIARPRDWPDWYALTGYWFLPRPIDWSPPDALMRFLDAGEPPICFSFSSMSDERGDELTHIVLAALRQIDRRGIIVTAWGGLRSVETTDRVYVIDHAPFDWLLPQCAAIVHHGGAGSTSAGLRAGIPSLIVSFFADQPFWGRRVYELSCGPKPIARKQLTIHRLAAALDRAVRDRALIDRAAEVGRVIQSEDGLTRAIAFIERTLASHG